MELIKPSVTLFNEPDPFKKIERIARVCYGSETKITEDSALPFVKSLIKRGHESPLEHVHLVVRTPTTYLASMFRRALTEYSHKTGLMPFVYNYESPTDTNADNTIWSGSIRAFRNIVRECGRYYAYFKEFFEHPLFEDLIPRAPEYFTFNNGNDGIKIMPKDPKQRDRHTIATFKIICSRAIANELERHRVASFMQSSTRYIHYKSGLQFIEPWWYSTAPVEDRQQYSLMLSSVEDFYKQMYAFNSPQPQKSRSILPLETATTLYMTATIEQWKSCILPLRTSVAAHPDIQIIANQIKTILEDV